MLTLHDISEVCSMLQRVNSYNLLNDKVTEKIPCTIYRPDKKQKMYWGVRNELSSNINLTSVSVHVREKLLNLLTELIQFTDQLAKKSSKLMT